MGSEWSETHLGNVVELKRGYDLPKKSRVDGDVPVVSSSGVSGTHNVSKVKAPGVVTGRYGTLGKVFLMMADFWPLNTTLYVKDFKGNDVRFISYFLRKIDYESCSDKAAVPGVNRNHLHMISVSLPPLQEQKAIAHILGTLDDRIELNRRMNETLEGMAKALFKSWFVDFDPVIDNAVASGKEIPEELSERAEARAALGDRRKPLPEAIRNLFPDEFSYSDEMGWIPGGWEVAPLSKTAIELRRGISPKYIEDGGVRVVNQRCIRNHEIDFSLTRRNDETKRKVDGRLLEEGDLLINSTGVGTLGGMAQVHNLSEPTVADSHVTIARTDEDKYLAYTFARMMLSIEPYIEAMGEGTTGQTELSRNRLAQIQVIVPPLSIQKVSEEYFYSFSQRASLNIQKTETLRMTRDTLLPKLLSGEVRIRDAEKMAEVMA